MEISLLGSTCLELGIDLILEGDGLDDFKGGMRGIPLGHPGQGLQEHGLQLGGLVVQDGDLGPPMEPSLCNNNVQRADEDMMVQGGGLGVQAYFEGVIVMGVEPEVGQEEVDQEVNVLGHGGASPGKRLLSLKKETFEVGDDALDEAEDDVVGVQDVDVGGGLAELDPGDDGGLRDALRTPVG